ncbi:MAG TPA: GAF domain-containing sensor histidine kinase [Gemmatimonadales bacterium]|nr:GAF domain-containing sensor histidine kinase [Gemmatimonadales bacterium]
MELSAALLQASVTLALAALCIFLFSHYRKAYLGWWALAWTLYLFRLAAIVSFLDGGERIWLFWHQVITGWTALALLWAALVFSQQQRWRWWYLAFLIFPPLWSYIAIYELKQFLWAAGPAVLFLALATFWTGWVFLGYRRRIASGGAALLAGAFLVWSVHHLDYPFLRARGAWNPWGYYIDILLELAVGAGIVLLVLDDLRRGIGALSALSGDLQRSGREAQVLEALLNRPLALPGVRGTALYSAADDLALIGGAGVAADWAPGPSPEIAGAIRQAIASGRPRTVSRSAGTDPIGHAYSAVLPIYRGTDVTGALVLVSDARDPFTALDDRFLVALGRQVGAALEHADLTRRLELRTAELERLSARMLEQHESERRRLSRELHDETAQVFSAVKMELGVLRDTLPPPLLDRLDHTLGLVDTGLKSIRRVVNDLRPSLLDDLGLLPAMRSLTLEFAERSGLDVSLTAPPAMPPLSEEAELALFRALQEALNNVARHAGASRIEVQLTAGELEIGLAVCDDGRGFPPSVTLEELEIRGHMGLAGMRERLAALGGTLMIEPGCNGGVCLRVQLPVRAGAGT